MLPPIPTRSSTAVTSAVLLVLGLLSAACTSASAIDPLQRLHACASDEGPADAYCGSLTVPEDRDSGGGRTIDLSIVLLPALGTDVRADPLFFLAGGPGQGAARMARAVREAFRHVQRHRDIVLVDQRGTGRSNALDCHAKADSLRELTEPDDVALARLRECLAGFDADVRFYTTSIAMDDLDEVRAHLGYERINLYGGSYGTRAALVYLRQHGERVRAVVLDGVAPPNMELPRFVARDAQRALDRLLTDCDGDPACSRALPGLAGRVRALLQRLERTPSRVTVTHPRSGAAEAVTIDARMVSGILFGALYSPLTASMLPALIDRAERDDFQGLLALAMAGEGANENMSVGMQLSVICSEDAPRYTPADIARESADTMFGSHLLAGSIKACEFWPRGLVAASYYEPVVSEVPALVLSGELDPITPPSWGDIVTRHLARARHITMPGTGHGAMGTACGARIVRDFLERGTADALDTRCVGAIRRPPFFLTPAGPDPIAASVPSS